MERIGREVERTLSRAGIGQTTALARVTAAWPKAVGEQIARRAWPLRLGRDGTLHVATESATWACELERLASDIMTKLSQTLGDEIPVRLRFRVGPIPESGPGPGQSSAPRRETFEVTSEAASAAAAAAAEIGDSDLREWVARAARASLSRPGSDRGF